MVRGLLVFGLSVPFGEMLYLGVTGQLGANPVERLLFLSGQGALAILLFLLIFPRVAGLLPAPALWGPLLASRRMIGLSLFGYATLHLLLYLADHLGDGPGLLKETTRPFVLSGLLAWGVLFLLSLTSTHYAKGRLKRGWKRLHPLVWLALGLLAVHLTLKEEGDWLKTLVWFGPLGALLLWQGGRTAQSFLKQISSSTH